LASWRIIRTEKKELKTIQKEEIKTTKKCYEQEEAEKTKLIFLYENSSCPVSWITILSLGSYK
jgi:hypothetical protein